MSDLIPYALAVVALFALVTAGFTVAHKRGRRERVAEWEARAAENEWFMHRFAAIAVMEPDVTATGRRIVAEDLYAIPEED